MAKKKRETVVVFSSHSDDFVIGAGGAIAEYTKEGKKVIAIVLSYGEKSHPWLKTHIIHKTRLDETMLAGKLLKCKVLFFDLREGHFPEDYLVKGLYQKLLEILRKENLVKVFTHSHEDPHPDHKATNMITLDLVEQLKPKPEVYIYSVWNPLSFKTRYPSLYVDISKTFSLKLKALRAFRSQKVHIAYPFMLLIIRAVKEGFKIRKKFAEKFFRIK